MSMRWHQRRQVVVSAAAALLACSSVQAVGVDVSAQLYALKGDALEAYSNLPNLPYTVTSRLGNTKFSDLSVAMQRALLWDSGALLSDTGDAFVQVMVTCGKTMQDIFLSMDTVELNADCEIVHCNALVMNYAKSTCTASAISSRTRCAVYDNTSVAAHTTVWSQEGSIDSDSKFRVYSSSDSNGTEIYTIVEKPSVSMADSRSGCPSGVSFIVPCQSISSSTADPSFCSPTPDPLVTMWLEDELNGSSSSDTFWKILAIVSTALFVLTLFVVVPVLVCCLKKRRQNSSETTCTTSAQQSSGVAYVRMDGWQSAQLTAGLSNRSAQQSYGDIDRYNDELCRRSPELATFCNDEALVMKQIGYAELHFRTLMAKGAYGEVWRGEFEGAEVAIKRLLNDKQDDIRAMEVFSREVRLASSLEHPNIVRYIGVSWRSLSELSMVSEFMPKGDLAHFLQAQHGRQLTWRSDKLPLAVSISNALVYLHSLVPVIIHRDLKSLNVLLSEDLTAKLSDFGLSREWSSDQTMTGGVGTLLWTAPEVLRGERYTEKADIYSFGIVLSELDTCLPPFAPRQLNNMEALPLIRNGSLKPTFRPDCPPELLALALSCVDNDPNNRPNAMQIVYMLRSKVGPTL